MSLVKSLPEETQEQLAALIHEQICEDLNEDMDDGDAEGCLCEDLGTVRDLLELLDRAGVTYSPLFVPHEKGNEDEVSTGETSHRARRVPR